MCDSLHDIAKPFEQRLGGIHYRLLQVGFDLKTDVLDRLIAQFDAEVSSRRKRTDLGREAESVRQRALIWIILRVEKRLAAHVVHQLRGLGDEIRIRVVERVERG